MKHCTVKLTCYGIRSVSSERIVQARSWTNGFDHQCSINISLRNLRSIESSRRIIGRYLIRQPVPPTHFPSISSKRTAVDLRTPIVIHFRRSAPSIFPPFARVHISVTIVVLPPFANQLERFLSGLVQRSILSPSQIDPRSIRFIPSYTRIPTTRQQRFHSHPPFPTCLHLFPRFLQIL